MSMMVTTASAPVEYPSRDGKRMADNTLQFRWIVMIQGGLDALFQNDPNVFVAGDLLWYPVEGFPGTVVAPDVMVVFGRPKGDRLSYKQWEEDDIPPKVVFEILSESNNYREMIDKEIFYEAHGVDEYYILDPDRHTMSGRLRQGEIFLGIRPMNGWVSPALGIRFEVKEEEIAIYGPDGTPFQDIPHLMAERNRVALERDRAAAERDRVAAERDRAAAERDRAAAERDHAAAERDQEQKRATAAEAKYAELLAALRAQGIDPEQLPKSN